MVEIGKKQQQQQQKQPATKPNRLDCHYFTVIILQPRFGQKSSDAWRRSMKIEPKETWIETETKDLQREKLPKGSPLNESKNTQGKRHGF